jgi:four helix bundle protein
MGDHRKLLVWKKAHALVVEVYRETARWPRHEQFGLISQARRAAVSIPANIAEGCGRDSDAELARHIAIAKGSAAELAYLLALATDLEYRPRAARDELGGSVEEVQRMLWSLDRKLRTAPRSSRVGELRSPTPARG